MDYELESCTFKEYSAQWLDSNIKKIIMSLSYNPAVEYFSNFFEKSANLNKLLDYLLPNIKTTFYPFSLKFQ